MSHPTTADARFVPRTQRSRSWLLLALAALLVPLAPAWAQPAPTTHVVMSAADDSTADAARCPGADCRLRDALAKAVSGDTIVFDATNLSGVPLTLTSELTVGVSVTIDGGTSDIQVSGNNAVRVFSVGNEVTLKLRHLTVRNGYWGTGTGGGGAGLHASHCTVEITSCTFSNNSASGLHGAAIYAESANLTVLDSTFSGNTGSYRSGDTNTSALGGGIYTTGGSLSVARSTFSANTGFPRGGAIYAYNNVLTVTDSTFFANLSHLGAGIYADASTTTVNNSTFDSNLARAGGVALQTHSGTLHATNCTFMKNDIHDGIDGGVVRNDGGSTYLANCTFADTIGPPSTGDMLNSGGTMIAVNTIAVRSSLRHCAGPIGGSNNLADDDTCGPAFLYLPEPAGLGVDTTLALNGGSTTTTLPLLAGSPAIDAGDPAACASAAGGRDQRGFVRPIDGDTNGTLACDIGAFEYGASPTSTATVVSSSLNPSLYGQAVTFTAHVNVRSGGSAPTGTVTFKNDGVTLPGGTDRPLDANGQATVSTGTLSAASHTITAVYSGDATYAASTGALSSAQVVSCPADTYLKDGACPDCTICAAGFFVASACTATADAVCLACDASCATCNGLTAALCTSCWAGSFLEGRACEVCTVCAPGTFQSRACTPTTNTICDTCPFGCATCEGESACTSCPTRSYLDGGTCKICSVCAAGMYAAKACTPTADTVCAACDARCARCDGPAATDCTSCADGKQLEDGVCGASPAADASVVTPDAQSGSNSWSASGCTYARGSRESGSSPWMLLVLAVVVAAAKRQRWRGDA